jgi:hypothetical protein
MKSQRTYIEADSIVSWRHGAVLLEGVEAALIIKTGVVGIGISRKAKAKRIVLLSGEWKRKEA